MKDWFVDGHFVSAGSSVEAVKEVKRLYGHTPEVVRTWTREDDVEAGFDGVDFDSL